MSEELDDSHTENMISAKKHCDVQLGKNFTKGKQATVLNLNREELPKWTPLSKDRSKKQEPPKPEDLNEKFLNKPTLVCSFTNKENHTDYVFSCGPLLLICDGVAVDLIVKRRFKMEFDVKKVFYHTFTVSRNAEKLTTAPDHGLGPKQRDYLVVCGEHKLQFISLPDYHFYYYEIPFKVRNVFPCATSLLVERFYDSSTEQNFHSHDTFHLYSLSGPFGELLPVIYKTNSFHPQWKFCWQSHQDEGGIVDADRNFVVVYDQKEKVHRIYMARETEEQEVHAAIRYVETLRKQHDSTMFASSLAPHSAGRTTHFDPTLRSPAMAALSDVISSDIDGRSPMTSQIRSSFGHSTPNNPGAGGFPGNLPTPIYDGNNDGHTWGHTPNTPRVNTRGGLERNIHTRTLARMVIDDAPGTSSSPTYARLQTTASPFHRTHLSQLCRRGDSNAELLKDFTRMIRDTPRNFTKNTQHPENDVDFGDLERDPDVDLLLSKLCLECVYVEPKQGAMEKANKVFVSTFLSDMYLNLVSAAGATMTVIPVWKNATTTRNNLTTKKYEPVTVDCIEATYVLKSGVTIVLGSEFTTTMYGGSEKIAPIFIDEISNTRNSLDFRFHPFSANRIMLVNHMRCIVLKIPETVTCLSANVFMKTCFVHLDREFAQKVLRKWKAVKRDVDVNKTDFEHQELVGVVVFMLEQVGVRVSKMTDQPRPDTPEGHGGKQMRPRMSQAEVIEMMRTYFEDMTFASRSELQKESDNVVRCRFTVELDSTEEGRKHARSLLDAVHSQCEDWAAQTLMHTVMMELVPYAFILSKVLNFHEYEAYYAELYRTLLTRVSVEYQISDEVHQKFLETVTPPAPCWSLNELVARVIFERATSENLGTLPSALSKESLQLLTVIATSRNFIETDADCKRWIGNNWKLRLGLCNDSSKAFWKIQKDFRSNAPGRANQIMTLFRLDRTVMEYMVPGIKVILLKIQTDAYAGATSIKPKKCIYATPEEQSSIAQLRWKNDIRRNNVHLMLSSSRPILIATNILRRNDDDNMKEMQDRFLSQTSYRTFSQPFGRAFFEFRTSVPSLLTGIYIPRLCLGGMVYPSRVSCDPPSTDQFKMHTEWGNFYNALSSALRIGGSDTVKIDNEWIVMVSKNIKSTAVVGGLVLGFGLNGHLAPFNMYHAHQMLSTFDKFHSVGLLLGLSASNITTCDNQIHKILATYLGFLMGPTPLEIRLDYTIQTSAISGLGLLFADSGNMNIAKKLINEIGKAATKDEEPVTDRSAYKLSAGFSLGLIMLGKGNGSATSVIPFKQNIPPLSQRLIYMMNGMRRDMCVFLPQTITPVVNDTPNLPFSNGGLMSTSQMANHVKENDNINIHQSAEPAALALGMMFMKTNNKYIASQLALPNTITDIERIKPDSMYARVLAYCLIMWDRIEPTKKFVKSLIPQVIGKYAVNALHFGIPIQKDDDGEDIQEPTDLREEQYWRNQVDTSTVSQTYLYTVSAACMAIALKYSSCGGPEEDSLATEAFKVIEFYTKVVLPEGQSRKDTGSMRMCNYAGQYTRSSVFAMLVTAMSILRVGTGDVEAMRYARLLRVCDRPDSSDWMATGKKHFEQMVAHQALGILMMGEGRYAFKKDNLSIALTIISTYPAIPQTVSDNSHYHQPLRFLWSMAVEPRLVVPYDVSESCVVEVDVLIVMKPRKEGEDPIAYKQKAPSLLPPLEDLLSISVGGGNYELVHINLRTEEELKVVKDVMSVGQGRIMLKRYSVDSPDMQIKESAELYEKTFNVLDLLQREDTALELDEDEIMKTIEKMEQELSLNSSDDYPNVQVQLNSVRDVTRRTPTELAEMQKRALHLLGGSLDLWRDEVNVSNSIHRLAESFQTMQI